MPREHESILSDEVIRELMAMGRQVAIGKFRFDRATAEDVVQTALLKAWLGIGSFRQTCAVTTWFYRIVVREALMHMRREKKHSVLCPIVDVILSDGNHHQERIIKKIENRTSLEVIEQAINHLSQKEQKCFRGFYVEEKTIQELAEVVGKTENNVKAHIYRSKVKVREECLVNV